MTKGPAFPTPLEPGFYGVSWSRGYEAVERDPIAKARMFTSGLEPA